MSYDAKTNTEGMDMQNKAAGQRFGKNNNSNGNRSNGASRSNRSFRFNSNVRSRTASRRRKGGEKIDISRFIQKSDSLAAASAIEIKHSFSDFSLCGYLQSNLKKRKFTEPTPIQDQAINHILKGRDLIGLANTGTGKTAAFLLPLIDKVYNDRSQKVLIIAPTRELAMQIENELRQFSWGMKIYFASCVGGLSINNQINNLKRNPNFVIGTPGRLKDLGNRNFIGFDSFNNIVIDEIDRMMDMGFIDEIREFLSKLPECRQSLFFSATLPPKIRELAETFLKDPVTVEVKSRETASNVDQNIVKVEDGSSKFDQLQELLSQPELSKVLIFHETKRGVEKLKIGLVNKGFKAESIHGDKTQGHRQKALSSFKNNSVDILVATDVAARGLDIKDITHVINYTVPQTYDDYIHRIGRTGRATSMGKALTFVEVG